MKKLWLVNLSIFICFSLIFMFVGSRAIVSQEEYSLQNEYVPHEVLVKFKEDIDNYLIRDTLNSVQGKIITYSGREISLSQWNPEDRSLRSFRLDPNLFHVRVPETIGTEQAIYALNLLPFVKYAEKNGIEHVCETEPNDPRFNEQWALKNTGDADIDAPEAWDTFTGSSDIIVAMIDSGIDLYHEDLAAHRWVNLDEVQGDNVDNDNNGYVDDI